MNNKNFSSQHFLHKAQDISMNQRAGILKNIKFLTCLPNQGKLRMISAI